MCIRDSIQADRAVAVVGDQRHAADGVSHLFEVEDDGFVICLLYTSDAADERSSVDLGGRRIIKKKKQAKYAGRLRH